MQICPKSTIYQKRPEMQWCQPRAAILHGAEQIYLTTYIAIEQLFTFVRLAGISHRCGPSRYLSGITGQLPSDKGLER